MLWKISSSCICWEFARSTVRKIESVRLLSRSSPAKCKNVWLVWDWKTGLDVVPSLSCFSSAVKVDFLCGNTKCSLLLSLQWLGNPFQLCDRSILNMQGHQYFGTDLFAGHTISMLNCIYLHGNSVNGDMPILMFLWLLQRIWWGIWHLGTWYSFIKLSLLCWTFSHEFVLLRPKRKHQNRLQYPWRLKTEISHFIHIHVHIHTRPWKFNFSANCSDQGISLRRVIHFSCPSRIKWTGG